MERSLGVKDFKILTALEERVDEALTQREIATAARLSVGTVNRAMADLHERGVVREGMLSAAGLEALEPYRVKRAVLIAAGFGSRLCPSAEHPGKPLIRVQGRRIIDSLLDAVYAAGIEEVYVVRGYLLSGRAVRPAAAACWHRSQVHREPLLLTRRTTSSQPWRRRICCRNRLRVPVRPLLLQPGADHEVPVLSSNYLGVPVQVTDDWCSRTRRGVITDCRWAGRTAIICSASPTG